MKLRGAYKTVRENKKGRERENGIKMSYYQPNQHISNFANQYAPKKKLRRIDIN